MKRAKTSKDVKQIMTSKKPVAVFFYMPGCPHCMAMEEPWKQLADEHKGLEFVIIDSDLAPDEIKSGGFPQFKLIRGGRSVAHADGEMAKDALKQQLLGGFKGGRSFRGTRRRRKTSRRSTRVHIPF